MRVRAKISFIALTKRMTIVELFVRTIEKSYIDLQEEGYIKKIPECQQKRDDEMMMYLTTG